jgi:mono/diheme cytochrome c family protein
MLFHRGDDMRLHRTIAALGLLTLAIAAHGQDAPPGDATKGRKQYMDFGCSQCHGTTGAGGGWQGPKIAPNPMAYAAFAYQLRTPRAQMPHYPQRLLSDQDVADIYAYMKSIPAGKPASQIELLKR